MPVGKVRGVLEALADAHTFSVDHATLGSLPLVASPLGATRTAPPLLGQHTHEVLAEVGYSADELATSAAWGAGVGVATGGIGGAWATRALRDPAPDPALLRAPGGGIRSPSSPPTGARCSAAGRRVSMKAPSVCCPTNAGPPASSGCGRRGRCPPSEDCPG